MADKLLHPLHLLPRTQSDSNSFKWLQKKKEHAWDITMSAHVHKRRVTAHTGVPNSDQRGWGPSTSHWSACAGTWLTGSHTVLVLACKPLLHRWGLSPHTHKWSFTGTGHFHLFPVFPRTSDSSHFAFILRGDSLKCNSETHFGCLNR